MRELKVYLRPDRVDRVVRALRNAGIPHMSIVHIRALESGISAEHARISFEAGTAYADKVKLELVCEEPETAALVELITEHARTGERGDGIIFVSPIIEAVKIRTGSSGRDALA